MDPHPPTSGPLTGLRIVEFAGVGPGPFCAMLLSDMGAVVITLDRIVPHGLGIKKAPRFNPTLRSRRSLRIDLKSPQCSAVALRLLSAADAMLEGNRPGVMERLGLGPADCLAANPKLVYGRMTGWGQDGPMAQAVGHDLTYRALTGALSLLGPADRPPPIPLNLLADLGGGGVYLALGLLAAMLHVRMGGAGQVVDAAMIDGIGSLMTHQFGYFGAGTWSEKREDNFLDGGAPWYNTYETADRRCVAVAAVERKFYDVLLGALGIDPAELPDQMNRAGWPAAKARLAAIFRQKTRAEWEAVMSGKSACFAPVPSPAEAVEHPHMRARGNFVQVDGVTQPAPAPRFSVTQAAIRCPPPEPGADSRAILANLGFAAEEIAALAAAGAIA